MYQPRHFQESRPERWRELVAGWPLATLVVSTANGLVANHLPMLWDAASADAPQGRLRGHLARANPLWRQGDEVMALAIFQGPQGYISPSWYAGKAEHGRVVPTWNYAVVHLHGRLRFIDEADWLECLLVDLTDAHEAQRRQPWRVEDAPADYRSAQLRAIVGVQMQVERVEAKFKLSQNKNAADQAGVLAGLADSGRDPLLREWMQRD